MLLPTAISMGRYLMTRVRCVVLELLAGRIEVLVSLFALLIKCLGGRIRVR